MAMHKIESEDDFYLHYNIPHVTDEHQDYQTKKSTNIKGLIYGLRVGAEQKYSDNINLIYNLSMLKDSSEGDAIKTKRGDTVRVPTPPKVIREHKIKFRHLVEASIYANYYF